MIAKAELEMAGDPVMLVGHLPHMGSLASLLIRGDPDIEVVRFAPATLVCCSGDGLVWQIAWVLTPELT
jgi:phosphohistidine phosphatase